MESFSFKKHLRGKGKVKEDGGLMVRGYPPPPPTGFPFWISPFKLHPLSVCTFAHHLCLSVIKINEVIKY